MSRTPTREMRVLVTRPKHQAETLQSAIAAAGGHAVLFPVMDIVARDRSDIERDLGELSPADLIIYVSPNAVKHGLSAMRVGGRPAAVGGATADALRTAGCNEVVVPSSGFNSEALLALPELQDVSGKHILIVRGDGGRELLESTLTDRGAQVKYLEVYERHRHAVSATALAALESSWRKSGMHYVVAMSVTSLEFLHELLPPACRDALRASVLVTPSARVLKTAEDLIPGTRSLLAASPAAEDLVAAILADRQG